jgi:cysteine desulfurase
VTAASARIYLDHAATSPVRPQAREAVLAALALSGNASSVHAAGRAARDRIETARVEICAFLGADRERLVFTSGGVEADNLAVASAVAQGSRRLIVGATEHPGVCVPAQASGAPVETLPVDRRGVADLDWLRDRLARWSAADGRPFVALMLANNETGVIAPIAEAAALVREAGGWLHVDAVAAAGKLALDLEALGADSLAVSAHKIGGPQGVGAFAWSERVAPVRQMHGGGHERGFRSGTENLPGIAGFAAAAKAAAADLAHLSDHAAWRDAAAERLKAQGAVIGGEGAPRTASTLSVAVDDWPSVVQVMALDLAGVCVSGGSACSSGKVKPSGVLEAMGFGALASGALRASGGWSTTPADWDRFADAWIEARARHVQRRAPAAAVSSKAYA